MSDSLSFQHVTRTAGGVSVNSNNAPFLDPGMSSANFATNSSQDQEEDGEDAAADDDNDDGDDDEENHSSMRGKNPKSEAAIKRRRIQNVEAARRFREKKRKEEERNLQELIKTRLERDQYARRIIKLQSALVAANLPIPDLAMESSNLTTSTNASSSASITATQTPMAATTANSSAFADRQRRDGLAGSGNHGDTSNDSEERLLRREIRELKRKMLDTETRLGEHISTLEAKLNTHLEDLQHKMDQIIHHLSSSRSRSNSSKQH